eukprot:6469353-Amphidinium_carterae.1
MNFCWENVFVDATALSSFNLLSFGSPVPMSLSTDRPFLCLLNTWPPALSQWPTASDDDCVSEGPSVFPAMILTRSLGTHYPPPLGPFHPRNHLACGAARAIGLCKFSGLAM